MKVIIAISLVFAVAIAEHVCFPREYTTDVVSYLPSQDDVFAAKTWFSYERKRLRDDVDVVLVNDKREHKRFSFLFDWTNKVMYTISYLNNTATCNSSAFNQPLEKPCLSKNAKHRGTVLIGGVIKADNWVEHADNGTVALDILADYNINVPIRVVRRHTDGHTSIDEFWNFKEKVDSDAFVVPSICKSVEISGEIESREAAYSLNGIPQLY